MSEIIVLCTVDSPDAAKRIATMLVEKRLAACVNIVPGLRSIYRWQDRICDEAEILLMIKSAGPQFEAIRAAIREVHPYQVPEIISIPIQSGDLDYLRWLRENSTSQPA
jgi:periplasmic divalent cation tolerance protein